MTTTENTEIAIVVPEREQLPPSLLANIETGFREAFAQAEKWRVQTHHWKMDSMNDLDLEIHGRSSRSMRRHGKPRFVCGYRRCGALDCPTCNPGGYEDHKEPVIRTSHDFPPIPDRSFDWSAVTDNYDLGHPIGHGATEAEAIADLKQQIEDNSNE